ncbi:MAG: putative ADP-ribosyl glycohydrolase [Homavirus sp.]|uniref:Putative ADP-ribosyl glycohydrolase n=1 Tax=Homavirus sp. TaxID=2487769 RepID=A0A3G5A4S1_9VIRU|nr:MAG: putative ADP-ribosyl glycohydrolase [Homavirus sp.]
MNNTTNIKKQYEKYKRRYINEKLSKNINRPTNLDKDKIFGTIHGAIYGDAFGARYEFLTKHEAETQLNSDKINGSDNSDRIDSYPIKGDGPFHIDAGQVTDDSEMMFGLLESITDKGGYDQTDVAMRYIKWYETKPIDIGNTIKRAICTRKKASNYNDMVSNSIEMNKYSLSNGALMRISPLGVLGISMTDDRLKQIVNLECDLTHPNALVKDVCYIYCVAIKYAILGWPKDRIFTKALNYAEKPRTKIILKDSLNSPEPSYTIDDVNRQEIYVDNDDKKYQGYIGIALQNAFYELMHSDNPTKSIVDVSSRGGDTDTNCAITGALLGAFYGTKLFNPQWYMAIRSSSLSTRRYVDFPFLNPLEKNGNYV